MLRVDIRDLQRGGPVRTVGELRPDDPAFEGLDLHLVGPISVTGQLQATGGGEYLWRGRVHGTMQGECRRCLTDVRTDVDITVDAAVFSATLRPLTIPIFTRCWSARHISMFGMWCARSWPSQLPPGCCSAEKIVLACVSPVEPT